MPRFLTRSAVYICLIVATTCQAARMSFGGSTPKKVEEELAYPCTISDFLASAPRQKAINHSESGVEWRVYSNSGAVMVEPIRPVTRKDNPIPSDFSSDPRAYKVDDGWLFGLNLGEFGGSLEWYSEDRTKTYTISTNENVNGFIQTNGALFVYEGLAHMFSNQGTIELVKKNAAGKWDIEPFVTLHEEPCAALTDTDGAMLVVTWSSVVKVWLSGKMKLLSRGEWLPGWGMFYPVWSYANSAVLDMDDTLYIGARQEVVKINSLHKNPTIEHIIRGAKARENAETAESKFFTEYANDMKSKDALVRQSAVRRMGGSDNHNNAVNELRHNRDFEMTFMGTNIYEAAEAVIPALNDESAIVRVEAARALGTLGHVVGAELLTKALDDPNGDVMVMAAWALGRLADDSLPGLLKGLKSANDAVASESCRSLGVLGGRASSALPALQELLRDDRQAVKAAAGKAIKQIADSASPQLAIINDPKSDKDARKSAMWELSQIGAVTEEVIPALVHALRDPDADVRSDAACAMKYINYIDPSAAKEAANALMAALSDESEPVAATAAEALGRFGPATVPKLIVAMQNDNSAVRIHAASAIYWMEQPAKEAAPDLLRLLDDQVPAVRQSAARALEHMGKEAFPATSRLIALMNNPDKEVRQYAIVTLGCIGATDEAVLPALNKAIQVADRDTQSAAFRALWTMNPRTSAVESAIVEAIANNDEFIQECRPEELGEMGRSLPKLIPALVHAAEKNLPWELAMVFGDIGADAATAVPVLIKGLKSPDNKVRLASARSLGLIGAPAAEAVSALSEMEESRDLRLIIEAEYALKSIRNPTRADTEKR
jgi:HEAT repeat protein